MKLNLTLEKPNDLSDYNHYPTPMFGNELHNLLEMLRPVVVALCLPDDREAMILGQFASTERAARDLQVFTERLRSRLEAVIEDVYNRG